MCIYSRIDNYILTEGKPTICEKCEGTGFVLGTKNDLRKSMKNYGRNFKDYVGLYRLWKDTNEVICPACGGEGSVYFTLS